MNRKNKNFCEDCQALRFSHFQSWLDEFIGLFLPKTKLPKKFELFFNGLLERILVFIGLARFKDDFNYSDIQLRSVCFIKELKKQGGKVAVFHGPFGHTNCFRAKINNKTVYFQGLPLAEFLSQHDIGIVSDKAKTKSRLQKGGFPIAKGKSFWFWQMNQAVKFAENLGYPLMVKPRSGSVARHVTTGIWNSNKLKTAIKRAVAYSPAFIIEKFLANAMVYRATVIDFDFVACVKQVPANIVGNGILTIRQLIDQKNSDSNRGNLGQKQYTLYKIVEDKATKELLDKKKYNFSTIPEKGEIVFLQKDPFLKLGGDLVEMTPAIHPDNLALFKQVAGYFDIRVVGMDFLIKDISFSWRKQSCAIIELNNVPCIELHQSPSSGAPQNLGKALVRLFFKYYL